jgi:carbonic anhydrase
VDLKKAIREKMMGKQTVTLTVSETPEGKTTAKSLTHEPKADAKAGKPSGHASAPANEEVLPAAKPALRPPMPAVAHHSRPSVRASQPAADPQASREYIAAKAAALTGHPVVSATSGDAPASEAHAGEVHWDYAGPNGPANWGKLKPEFNACALGKRQSPINIEDSATLKGPAEPLVFNYVPSNASVVNNGHTVQVDLEGDNRLTVRGTTYRLAQFHFHTPSEEQINFRSFAMVAHLVHKSEQGQLAVVAVLLEPGEANPFIDKVWTYMPLDVGDRVRVPPGLLDVNEFLPKDQRYYQFMGSLTTPPCTEGVLWMVLKQPVTLSQGQWRLFSQLFPNNARPVQPVNGRPVRNAQ